MRLHECTDATSRKHREDNGFFGAFPKDIVAEVVNGDVTNCKTADVSERLKVLEGDSRIEVPKKE